MFDDINMEPQAKSTDKNGTNNSTRSSTLGSRGRSDDDNSPDVTGWLMKRTKMSHKWKRQWFHLKGTTLCYGDQEESTKKKILLESAEITESCVDGKDNAFRVKPKDSRRTFYMFAEDETTQHNWMQAICFAKAAASTNSDSQACVIQ